jgi:hypothetical protein
MQNTIRNATFDSGSFDQRGRPIRPGSTVLKQVLNDEGLLHPLDSEEVESLRAGMLIAFHLRTTYNSRRFRHRVGGG